MKENINDKQTEFDITDENYEVYEKLSRIKNGTFSVSDEKTIIKICIATVIGTLALIGSTTFLALNLVKILNLVKTEISASVCAVSTVGLDFAGVIAVGFITPKIVKKIRLRKFEKENPEINTNVDLERLEKELTKYKELKTVSKDMEEKKEYFSTLHSDEYNKMTQEEKMDSLNKEIEYLGQVMIEEKYKNQSTEDKPKTLKKTYNTNDKK